MSRAWGQSLHDFDLIFRHQSNGSIYHKEQTAYCVTQWSFRRPTGWSLKPRLTNDRLPLDSTTFRLTSSKSLTAGLCANIELGEINIELINLCLRVKYLETRRYKICLNTRLTILIKISPANFFHFISNLRCCRWMRLSMSRRQIRSFKSIMFRSYACRWNRKIYLNLRFASC